MFSCDVCSKSFKSNYGLANHKRTHDPAWKRAASVSDFSCIQCGAVGTFSANRRGKFCSNQCQGLHRSTTHTSAILQGTATNKRTIKRFLKSLRGDCCALCNQPPVHNGKPLVMQLDHIDGVNSNNAVENLRLLCPNCHSQTDTYAGRNKGKRSEQMQQPC